MITLIPDKDIHRYDPFLFDGLLMVVCHACKKPLSERFKRYVLGYFMLRPSVSQSQRSAFEYIQQFAVHENDREFAYRLLRDWFPKEGRI